MEYINRPGILLPPTGIFMKKMKKREVYLSKAG
jgi:hypothetical protein